MALTVYRIDRDQADRLLFLFHGWSAEQHHLAAYVPLVDPDERFTAICPRGPIDLPEGDGASWFERGSDGPDPRSFLGTLDTLATFVDEEAATAGIPPEHCVIGGFSQGGALALALAGRPAAPAYAGVWAMCCGLPAVAGFTLDLAPGAGRPGLVQLGERDGIVPPERVHRVTDALSAAGWRVRTEGYDMAHSQTLEMMADARDWLAAVD